MLRLSYIVPLFNCGDCISSCLDSLLGQGLSPEEYEVIVVNDGSTDGGESVVSDYCSRYGNFRLINQPHEGVAAARNRGIESARGEYIHFMDADDRLLPDGMRILFDNYVTPFGHPDMVGFWSHIVDRYYDDAEWEAIRPHELIYHGDFLNYGCKYGIGYSACACLISSEFIKKRRLRFSGYRIGEDMLFMLEAFRATEAVIAASSLDIYRYVVRSASAMNRLDKKHVTGVFHDLSALSGRICGIGKESPYPVGIFMRDLNTVQRWAFTRLCGGDMPYKELKECLIQARERNFFSVNECSTRTNRFICHIYRHTVAVYVFAFVYRRLFIPYIKPWLRRN